MCFIGLFFCYSYLDLKGLIQIIPTNITTKGLRVGDVTLFCTCGKVILLTRYLLLPFLSVVFVRCHFVSVVFHWLGGSFAKFAFSVG
jgi:hypothetical protein